MASCDDGKRRKLPTNREQDLLDAALSGDVVTVQRLIDVEKVFVDCLDKNGMTPLQQAAFRGHATICRFLLDSGADVNSNEHDNGYSALMFAALSGDKNVTKMMLEAGANVSHTNSVNRNASQMAAFVSNHDIVSLINNFLPMSELQYYVKPTGLQKQARLSEGLVKPLHGLILLRNLHPVKVVQYLSDNIGLVEEAKSVSRVLDDLIGRHMDSHDTHEGLALKLHYLACVLRQAAAAVAPSTDGGNSNKHDALALLLRKLAKGRESDGFLENAELLARSTLKSFSHLESTLFQQVLKKIASIELGCLPTAAQVLDSSINGMRMSEPDSHECTTCCDLSADKRCSKCKAIWYCSAACQKLHWPAHKRSCRPTAPESQPSTSANQGENIN